ncbi:Glycolipid 2-alpha-mannosyltransferase 2 [Neolecta irregularis DAH-3]|uniref:Glycolipid 2-alpha-mannosyltransferase 2 n=1 Tax=Neolecta irregularis (strain DAH-3) TaxID=1198029 RepID=A0A1U7LQC9_NEOID|nr:Glycolipid 2-alpha-mannosyltransferase 2 [Neolecta irregularis DAH-3]|eukprot:OLL24876.1 Glycolipid 2-alpha-mannosyltransferase 2 [Neolecta irregularis DAH-3]
MEDSGKVYGFTLSLPEDAKTIPTLWETTKAFMAKFPDMVAKENFIEFISNDGGNSYNGCHFWSNFEIGNLVNLSGLSHCLSQNFWRNVSYSTYFDYLDQTGGFFYERWGDAPIHSIATAMFLKPEQVLFFNDIGYTHSVFTHCPNEPEFRHKCHCNPADSIDLNGLSIATLVILTIQLILAGYDGLRLQARIDGIVIMSINPFKPTYTAP